MSEEIFESDFEGDEEECGEYWPSQVNQTSIMAHVLDHKMFLAARRIQSYWRGHRVRKLRDQRWQAAIAIQRWWRGFWLRRHLWALLERRLQETLLDHYHRAATCIQARIRGWRVRRHILDMRSLRRTQTAAAEELLHCLTLHLHHLQRTEYLPGISSMLETSCKSQIEKLDTIMRFRFYNGRMVSMVATSLAERENERSHFWGCRFFTEIPYAGPNFNQLCADPPEEKEAVSQQAEGRNRLTDPQLLDIAAEYQAFQRNEHFREMHLNSGLRKRQEYIANIDARERSAKEHFCHDVIKSMRGWRIWSGANVEIKKDIFSSPEKLESFFEKVQPVLDEYGVNCHCLIRALPAHNCQEAKV